MAWCHFFLFFFKIVVLGFSKMITLVSSNSSGNFSQSWLLIVGHSSLYQCRKLVFMYNYHLTLFSLEWLYVKQKGCSISNSSLRFFCSFPSVINNENMILFKTAPERGQQKLKFKWRMFVNHKWQLKKNTYLKLFFFFFKLFISSL